MSFQVDGIIEYTPEGKINCTIVDIKNKQKYTIVQSGITETAAASEEDIAKLSGTQSCDDGGPADVNTTGKAVIKSDVSSGDVSSGDENPQQDTVAEQINTEIKNKKIPDVTKLEFVLQKSPETGADEEKAAQETGADVKETAAVVADAAADAGAVAVAVKENADAVKEKAAAEKSAVLTGAAAAAQKKAQVIDPAQRTVTGADTSNE